MTHTAQVLEALAGQVAADPLLMRGSTGLLAQAELVRHAYAARPADMPKLYRASLGRRREFLSQRDAQAYDEGCRLFRSCAQLTDMSNTPRAIGYHDEEARYDERLYERMHGDDE